LSGREIEVEDHVWNGYEVLVVEERVAAEAEVDADDGNRAGLDDQGDDCTDEGDQKVADNSASIA